MFLIPSEKAKTTKIDENGKLHQWLWKPKFLKTITHKLSLIVKVVTMRQFPFEDLALNQENEDSQQTNLKNTPSNFSVHEPEKTLKLTPDTLDGDNVLVN